MLSSCYHKHLSEHSSCRHFSISFAIIFIQNFILHPTEKPVEPKFYGYLTFGHKLSCDNKSIFRLYYSMIAATRPDPTVRPPSRIAKVRPCSIAIGWISSIVISTLSPGMHISVPSGRLITPVTSVVLK